MNTMLSAMMDGGVFTPLAPGVSLASLLISLLILVLLIPGKGAALEPVR